jgi:hypothetical protein
VLCSTQRSAVTHVLAPTGVLATPWYATTRMAKHLESLLNCSATHTKVLRQVHRHKQTSVSAVTGVKLHQTAATAHLSAQSSKRSKRKTLASHSHTSNSNCSQEQCQDTHGVEPMNSVALHSIVARIVTHRGDKKQSCKGESRYRTAVTRQVTPSPFHSSRMHDSMHVTQLLS